MLNQSFPNKSSLDFKGNLLQGQVNFIFGKYRLTRIVLVKPLEFHGWPSKFDPIPKKIIMNLITSTNYVFYDEILC